MERLGCPALVCCVGLRYLGGVDYFDERHEALLRHLEAAPLWKITSPRLTKAGVKLFRSGRVEEVGTMNGGLLWARVRGKDGRRFTATLGLDGDPASSLCDCRRDAGCEHIVAAVLASRANAARWRRQLAPVATPEDEPSLDQVPTDRPTLELWARDNRVQDLLQVLPDAFAQLVAEHAARHISTVTHLRYRDCGLIDVVCGRAGLRTAGPLRMLGRRFLLERATARAVYYAAVRARRTDHLEASDPRVARHLAEIVRQRAALLERGVLPREPDERRPFGIEVGFDPVRVQVTEANDRFALTLELTPDGAVGAAKNHWSHTDARVFEVLDVGLHLLTSSEHAPLARRIADDLCRPGWRRLVDDLRGAIAPAEQDATADFALGWRMSVDLYGGVKLTPVECRAKARGGWKTKQIKGREALDAIDVSGHPGDAVAVKTLRLASNSYNRQDHAPLPLALALPGLVGHPRFFFKDGREQHLELRRGAVALATQDVEGGFRIGFEVGGRFWDLHRAMASGAVVFLVGEALFIDEEAGAATLCPVSPQLDGAFTRLARRRPEDAVIPSEGSAVVAELARDVMTRMPLSLSEGLLGPSEPADATVRVRMTLHAAGLEVRAVVTPAPELASEVPGEGPPVLHVERAGELVAIRRDLDAEREAALRLWRELSLEPAPHFVHRETLGDDAIALVHTLSKHDEVEVEWATEDRVTIAPKRVGFDALALEAKEAKGRQWFTLHGAAEASAGGAIPLPELLRAIREHKRYVRVDDGSWARIDETVSRKLSAVAKRDGKVPRLMAPLVAELEEAGATLEGFVELSEALERLRRARGLVVATPDGLEAELRPYQREGFQWLARLAEWAPGACLADDMGLGKTVQALALLLQRRQTGPALVVAPTSLGFNWAREAERFAPSLRVRTVRSGAEIAALGVLSPGDLVVTSYGLVTRHAEVLATTRWGTLVADEAQAVKNASTLRSRALRRLEAGFTLALTGTPVENRASELWSLFRLIAPGLLGSEGAFREDYAAPIERGDTMARQALAGLVAPFVLRRLKREVARELPERTEVQLEVVLKKAERARYEEIRRATLETLAGESGSGQGRVTFVALQALTRLRQVACHPALVDPQWTQGAAKLDALMDLLERLGEEGHRALVFSQFTSFLALVRERLEQAGVGYLYLDGQTPAAAREARVDAFQSGEADVFLLSLKAGGTGLNLTAATYVIHLDPWWNPAAEDQATDRAHRIGQDQPVTVYRLIAKDTVEEGIVTLHGNKRELADALLAGSGSSASLGYEEMLALIGGYAETEAVVDEDDDDDRDTTAEDAVPAGVIDLAAVRAQRAKEPAPTEETEPRTDATDTAPDDPETTAFAAFERAIAAAVATKALAGSTASKYRSGARRYVAFALERGLDPRREDSLDRFIAAVEAGELEVGKSVIPMARAAFRWFPSEP